MKWEAIRVLQLFLEHVLLKQSFENSENEAYYAYFVRLFDVSSFIIWCKFFKYTSNVGKHAPFHIPVRLRILNMALPTDNRIFDPLPE